MVKELPSLAELQKLRLQRINAAISNGIIDAAFAVTAWYGTQFSIRHWEGEFYKLKKGEYEIRTYLIQLSYSPHLKRTLEKKRLNIMRKGVEFVSLALEEPDMTPDLDSFVVPGAWEDFINELHEEMKAQDEITEQEIELKVRQKLAKLLHIT